MPIPERMTSSLSHPPTMPKALFLALCVLTLCFYGLLNAHAQTTPKNGSERWEKDIQKFESQDKAHPPKHGGIEFVGSSSIRMWDSLPDQLAGLPVVKRGFGGSQMSDCIAYAHRIILPYKPSIVYVYEGDNDIGGGKTPEAVVADFKKLVEIIHSELPHCRIGFIAIKPSIKRCQLMHTMHHANMLVSEYCNSNPLLAYIDIYTPTLNVESEPIPDLFKSDGLHLNEKGYAIWISIIKKQLKESGWITNVVP